MSVNEKIFIDVSAQVDEKSFKTAENETKIFARDTKKELDKALLLELQINKAKLQLELENTRALLRKAKKDWDEALALELQLKTDKLKSELTEAWRQLNNYQNTWDKALSRLQAKFNQTNNTIKENWKSIFSLWGAMESLKAQAIKLWWVLAWVFAAKTVLDFAKDIDLARSEIVKATGASWEALKGLTNVANDVFKTVPETMETIWKAIWEINTRFWVTGEELQFLTKDFLDFARITGQDVQQAVRGVSRLLEDTWEPIENTWFVLDLLTKAGQDTWVELNKLVNTATNFWVQFRNVWFSLEETIALLAKFEKEWVSTEKITSWLTQALNNLAKKGFTDLRQGFNEYFEAIKNAETQTEAITKATEIFGARAAADLAIAIREWRFEIDELVKSLENSEWALSKTAKEALTLDQRMTILWNQFKAELIPILESIIPVAEKIIDVVPKIIVGWKALTTFFVWFFADLILGANKAVNNIWNTFWNLIDRVKGVWNIIQTIFSNLVSNIWNAFGNIPVLAQKWLNTFLRWIEKTINAAIWLLNKIPWVDVKWVSLEVGFNGWELKQIKSLTDWIDKVNKDLNNSIQKRNEETARKNAILETARVLNAKDTADKIEELWKQLEKTQDERQRKRIKAEQDWLAKAIWLNEELVEAEKKGWWARIKTEEETQKELEKQREEAEKLELDRQARALKFRAKRQVEEIKQSELTELEKSKAIIKLNDKLNKDLKAIKNSQLDDELEIAKLVIEKEKEKTEKIKDNLKWLEDWYKKAGDVFDDSIKKSKKTVEDFTKDIQKLVWEIAKIDEELWKLDQNRADTLWKRNLEIDKELEKLRAEEIQDTQTINKLLQEKRLIEANATKEELEEAKRLAELSPTARFLEEFEAKKLALEEDRALRQQEIEEFEAQKAIEEQVLVNLTNKKVELDENYARIKMGLEQQITDDLFAQTKKREAMLESLRLKALATAAAMRSAWMSGGGWSSTSINNSRTINVWWVQVNSEADFERIERTFWN